MITGGASFIGSHLADRLVELGASVHVVDDFSSGRIENVQPLLDAAQITVEWGDLHDETVANRAFSGADVVFHLAAAHGGRGYVDLHQAACAENLHLDGLVFRAAQQCGVGKIVYASSGCVYPLYLQRDVNDETLLTEDMAGPPYEADGMYGNAKLMGELTLRALCEETGMTGVSCRYFTVYGPRGVENHAVIAMMARALVEQDPYVIWGDGTQIRNWTYVSDIVEGTVLAAEHLDDGSAVNLGTSERITVQDAAKTITALAGHDAAFEFRTDMPTGPVNRVASFAKAERLMGWRPRYTFAEGVRETYEWYRNHRDPEHVREHLPELLVERGVALTAADRR